MVGGLNNLYVKGNCYHYQSGGGEENRSPNRLNRNCGSEGESRSWSASDDDE